MTRILISLWLCLAWGISAQADEKSDFLKSIQLPDSLGDFGRKATNKLLGREIVFQKDGETISYIFAPAGHVLVTKNGRPVEGYFGNSSDKEQLCFRFDDTKHGCYRIWANAERMTMTDKNGNVLEGTVSPATSAAPQLTMDKNYCSTFKKITKAARKGNFYSLLDGTKAVDYSHDETHAIFQSTVSLANQHCTFDRSDLGNRLECPFLFKAGDPRAEQVYEFLVTQFEGCMASQLMRSRVDSHIYDKYESGFANDEKIIRDSSFDLLVQATTEIELGNRFACTDLLTCQSVFGVWFSTRIW